MKLRAALIAGLLVAVDQLTKFWASMHLELNNTRPLLKNVLHLTLVRNSGAAFGFFKERAAVFIFISVVAILLILFYAKRFERNYRFARTGLLLILAGTIGNLIDRIRFGYVVDFIDLRIWPVFNFADIFISLGGLLLICHILVFGRDKQHIKP
ncbi:MAG: signal peptidase II [Candidatus Omnitrophica bacterium]|nr:signal peptidase II [Candidatus Omnitrophota bacterium]MBU4487985.1 signal peptidase II [Candidatus Omnitrophota bacterium]MCG2704772.1 signal peptidase II [Candidatus Omnitrophota bacterium]